MRGKGGAEEVGDEGDAEKGGEAEEDDEFGGGGVGVVVVVGVVEPRRRSHCVMMESEERHLFICKKKQRNLDGRGNKQRLGGANGFASSFLSQKSNVYLVPCVLLYHAQSHRKSSPSFFYFAILFFFSF